MQTKYWAFYQVLRTRASAAIAAENTILSASYEADSFAVFLAHKALQRVGRDKHREVVLRSVSMALALTPNDPLVLRIAHSIYVQMNDPQASSLRIRACNVAQTQEEKKLCVNAVTLGAKAK
jgi:hypothetical protein